MEKQQFTHLVALKNYFGEKTALITGFFEFSAVYLTVPAIIGIPVTIA